MPADTIQGAATQPRIRDHPTARVLIADDAPAMRAALRGLLEDHGLSVIGEADNGLQTGEAATDQGEAVRKVARLFPSWRSPRSR